MSTHQPAKVQMYSPQLRLFQKIYDQKYSKTLSNGLAEKRKILNPKLSRRQSQNSEQQQSRSSPSLLRSRLTRSVGSLLPRIQQIELIAKSTSKGRKAKPDKQLLSSLQIYFTQKKIKKESEENNMFLTQNKKTLSDKVLQQRFGQLISVATEAVPKTLRALLALSAGDKSQELNLKKVQSQKLEITAIVKNMIQSESAKKNSNQIEELPEDSGSESEQFQGQPEGISEKGINWVLNQCKNYQAKFKVTKKKKTLKKSISPKVQK